MWTFHVCCLWVDGRMVLSPHVSSMANNKGKVVLCVLCIKLLPNCEHTVTYRENCFFISYPPYTCYCYLRRRKRNCSLNETRLLQELNLEPLVQKSERRALHPWPRICQWLNECAMISDWQSWWQLVSHWPCVFYLMFSGKFKSASKGNLVTLIIESYIVESTAHSIEKCLYLQLQSCAKKQ